MIDRLFAALGGAIALGAFVFMVKLMHDMTAQMVMMTEQVGRMAEQVAQMNGNVGAMGADVRGMRQSMERMSGIVQRGGQQLEQLEQLNPMEVMRGVIPGQPSR
jgi:methyl-accepting chemotaxis protein